MSFSYSKISTYEKCPKKFYYKYVEKLKVPFEDKPVFEKGRYIHYLIENYPEVKDYKFRFQEVRDKQKDYLKETLSFIEDNKKAKFLLSEDILVDRERYFYLDEDCNVIKGRKGSLFNGIIDYIGQYKDNIIVVDWKTGMSQNFASLDQLKFYSLYIFNDFPSINKLKIFLFFVEQNDYKCEEVTREDYEQIKEKYLNLIKEIQTETEYKCQTNKDCLHCDFYNECKPFTVKMKGK